jgi:hypothetical protein
MKRVIWLLILILVSCSKSKEDLPEQTPLEIVKAEKPEVKFQQMEFKKEDMPLSIKNFKGLIEKGLRWNDINGDNIFIFTEEPSINIDELDGEEAFGQAQFWHGYHYCNYNSGEYKLVREFKDGIGFCFAINIQSLRDKTQILNLSSFLPSPKNIQLPFNNNYLFSTSL